MHALKIARREWNGVGSQMQAVVKLLILSHAGEVRHSQFHSYHIAERAIIEARTAPSHF